MQIDLSKVYPALGKIHVNERTDFLVIPEVDPKITKLFKTMTWNAVEKSLQFTIKENDQFDGFKWFEKIMNSSEKAKTDTFAQQKNNCIIIFLNERQEEISGFRFSGLKPKSHLYQGTSEDTNGYDDGYDDDEPEGVFHDIAFEYDNFKNLFYRKKEISELMIEVDPGQKIDEEWKVKE